MDEETPLLNGRSPSSQSKADNSKLFLAVFSAILGNFNAGFSLVYPSPVLHYLKSPDADPRLRMDNGQAAWFSSIYSLGAVLGGLATIGLNDMIGRKESIMLSALPSTIGYMLMGGAYEQWMLHFGRFLTGVASGMSASSIPVYISEISCKAKRGTLGACPQMTAVTGALVLYGLGVALSWRWLAIVGSFPALLMVLLLVFMPSSPRRLLSLGQEHKAEQTLRWLRGKNYNIHYELQEIQDSINNQTKITWSELRTPQYYRPLLITLVMRFLQQMSGITPILIYLEPIFATSKVIEPRYEATIVGATRLVSVVLAAVLMDKAGRKALLYTSSILMFASTLTLTMVFHGTQGPPSPAPPNMTALDYSLQTAMENTFQTSHQTTAGIVPLISIIVFIFGYAMGWGPITWLLMSEVLPLAVRGKASGMCVTVSWLTGFALTQGFTHLMEPDTIYISFLFFTVVSVLCLLFNAVCIPETRKRSLEEIENFFRTGRSFTITKEDQTINRTKTLQEFSENT